jgi:hypothetical protein
MKEVTKTVFVAFDETEYLTREECADYEANIWWRRLVGLTESDITAALARENAELADALEKAGQRIAQKRRESGELRRRVTPVEPGPQISTNPDDRHELGDAA